MNESGFHKLYWGFLFILIDFRINGFDILPNVIGYIISTTRSRKWYSVRTTWLIFHTDSNSINGIEYTCCI